MQDAGAGMSFAEAGDATSLRAVAKNPVSMAA
jgi:hypothetical protein